MQVLMMIIENLLFYTIFEIVIQGKFIEYITLMYCSIKHNFFFCLYLV